MRFLLDTHTFIWFMNGDDLLPKTIIKDIQNTENECFISIASIWEIAIKISLNKLELKSSFDYISKILLDNEIEALPIKFEEIQKLIQLPFHHRDPFDRIIVCQAIQMNLTILSKDEYFKSYDVKLKW